MPNTNIPESQSTPESNESFGDLLSQFEKSRPARSQTGGRGLSGTVVRVSGESVLVDVGAKTEGLLPAAAFQKMGQPVQPGDKLTVTITGRDQETGYYQLSLGKVERLTDWVSLEKAFSEQTTIVGKVTGLC